MISIIADHLDRLCPDQVDKTPIDYGRRHLSGHIGHNKDPEKWPVIGWFCDGGNVGNPVFSIHPGDLAVLASRLEALPDGTLENTLLRHHPAFAGLRVEWHV